MARGLVTEQVRELAELRGVAERTVWRWFARMRAEDDRQFELIQFRHCDRCDRALPQGSTIRRRFCSDRCRVAHHRDRQRGGRR